MNHTDFIFAPIFLPLLGAALAFCAKAFLTKKSAKILEYTAVFIGLGLPWIVMFYLLPLILAGETFQLIIGNWSGGVGIMFRFDGLAWLINLLGYSVASAAWVYSQGTNIRGPGFSAIFLIQISSLAATSMTYDLFNLFVCLEVMGISSYVLVASSEKKGAFLASFSYLMVSATAMIFFLIGLFGLYRLTGALTYEDIAGGLNALPDNGGITAIVSLSMIVAAVAMRVAVMPLYGWLPDAHAMAPHAISAILSGVLIKTPLFALYRILIIMPGGMGAGELMGYAGAVTALAAVLIALSQKDTKQLLAYHSISQIGYIVCAWGSAISVGVSTPLGLTIISAAFLHAFYHALFKGLLFLTIGTTTDQAGERDVYTLRNGVRILYDAGEKIPVTFLCYMTGALAIMAIPPLNGYASKTAISYALKGSWQGTFLMAAAIGTIASFIKLTKIYLPEKKGEKNTSEQSSLQKVGKVHITAQIAQIFLAAMCITLGVKATSFSRFVFKLLSSGETIEKNIPPNLYSMENLNKTALIAISGWLLYLIVSTKTGKKILSLIRNRPKSFHGLFSSMALGMGAMALWMIWRF